MKSIKNHKKFKWRSLLITFLILGIGLSIMIALYEPPAESNTVLPETAEPSTQPANYSPELFSELILAELNEMKFANRMSFVSHDDGFFTISGTFTDTDALIERFKAFAPYNDILIPLEQESFFIRGHIGENERGTGRFIIDQFTLGSAIFPAGYTTEFIEQNTDLNDYLDAPIEDITLNASGVLFRNALPRIIQIALYTRLLPSEQE